MFLISNLNYAGEWLISLSLSLSLYLSHSVLIHTVQVFPARPGPGGLGHGS